MIDGFILECLLRNGRIFPDTSHVQCSVGRIINTFKLLPHLQFIPSSGYSMKDQETEDI